MAPVFLKRFYLLAQKKKPDTVIRIAADCPFIDHLIIDKIIKIHFKHKNDYTMNNTDNSYPKGTDMEIFSFKSFDSHVI